MAHSLVYYFDIPVPNCLPPTMKTDVGTVGYALEATIHLPSGALSTSKPLTISYRLLSPAIPLTYHRRFTGYPLTVQTTIAQQPPNDDTSKATFSVELVTRNLLTPGVRDGEMRHIVITAIKWRVDEVAVRINTACSEMQASTNTNDPSTRSLIGGMLDFKPSKATIRSTNQGLHRDDRFQVRFDIRIPESTNAADDVCQGYCPGDDRHGSCPLASSPGISVNHELKVEIMTEEDIFNRKTNKLLARKGIGRLYGSTYPLRIHKLADNVDDMYNHYFDEPPAFDMVREMIPPSYET
ncbi:hypothetical protein AbraIFM66950_011142 [Aspergillus brasiliensis]|nr:hypothetical protein AbraIFM66950_011142 [Aspergillus brasiliensis]